MRHLLILLIVLTVCCSKSTNSLEVTEQKKLLSHIIKKDICKTNYHNIEIGDTNEDEFYSADAYSFFFKGNEKDSSLSLEYNSYRKPFEVNTQNKKIIFKNISPDYEDAQQNYFYFGYNGQLNKHLVYASYYEHEEFLLIDHSTACIDTLNGRPYFSPNLKKVFSFYINPYEETEINGSYYSFVSDVEICIFFNNGSIKTIKHSFDFIPLEIRWKDDNTLLIKALSSEDYENVNGRLSEKTDCVYKRVTIK